MVRVRFLLIVALLLLGTQASAADLPVAATIPLQGTPGEPGMVIRYDEIADQYMVSRTAYDALVYGVVGERPAIVYMTSTTSVPVVTQGVTNVLVNMSNGDIRRGDLLTTSDTEGVAMVAGTSTMSVFAVVLEDAVPGAATVVAEVDVTRAQALQKSRQNIYAAAQAKAAAAAAGEEEPKPVISLLRKVFAGMLVLGALGFLLYSFRSILSSSVVSIGRNPRARTALILAAGGSMVMALVIALVTVLAAIGVLVLPVL